MKITVNNTQANKETPFPKLMIGKQSGIIILATGIEDEGIKGVVIGQESGVYKVGYYYDGWNRNNFKDYSGTITLEND